MHGPIIPIARKSNLAHFARLEETRAEIIRSSPDFQDSWEARVTRMLPGYCCGPRLLWNCSTVITTEGFVQLDPIMVELFHQCIKTFVHGNTQLGRPFFGGKSFPEGF